ncbi:hypothetical protein [Chitinophaga agri]|uniref:Uncharacterized protein n=1 Tax=Chitinophaga agri TaxID=2703787 RepID=A0A6B9ZCL1_9BACT|nr:hypothetical protein [Chitinophaga agri]QHS59846.1 hypothetical protein GWR21_09670 [Chitinophaga agri]
MSYKFPSVKLNKQGLFGPTQRKHYYKPVTYHNKSANNNLHKTKWVLKQNEQYEAFRVSDEAVWHCDKNCGLFSILNKGEVIQGSNDERLSFFPTPNNSIDAWHGYPVDTSQYEPSTELVDRWFEEAIIDERIRIKILKAQL